MSSKLMPVQAWLAGGGSRCPLPGPPASPAAQRTQLRCKLVPVQALKWQAGQLRPPVSPTAPCCTEGADLPDGCRLLGRRRLGPQEHAWRLGWACSWLG